MATESVISFLVSHPEWGWLLLLGLALEQLYAPWDTKTDQIISDVKADIQGVREAQVAQMTVIRALARSTDEIDTEQVDEYLEANGVDPSDFLVEE